MTDSLEQIWKNSTCDYPSEVVEYWWSLILKKYNENGRNSHNYEYLVEKFRELDDFGQYIKNIQAFTIALFFQYLQYSPNDIECHEKNLQNFFKFADEVGISKDSDLFKDVKKLLEGSAIHSTEEHKTKGAYGNNDLHYFLDLDMSVLGSPEKKYLEYTNNTHSEYSILDDVTYKNLRKKVLQSFLLIPNIFATKLFRDKYETQARKNIQEELNSLMKS